MTRTEIKYYGFAPNEAGLFEVFACHKTGKQPLSDSLGRTLMIDRQEVIGTYKGFTAASKACEVLNRELSVERFGN
jgi:hypothetical protein